MSKIGVVIHGTNSGSGIIYISESILDLKFNIKDYRGGKDDKSLKKRCLSISFDFNQNNFCLTKYEITFDKRKRGSLGYVALTSVIPFYKNLNIDDLLNKIDDLFDVYISLTVDEGFNYEHEPNEKFYKKIEQFENSIQVDELSLQDNQYKEVDINTSAYFFYEDKDRLIKLLQNPYHSVFYEFHQIYLLDASEKDSVNALNALKHDPNADLTNKIDLDNPDYTITTKIAESITLKGINNGLKVKLKDKVVFGFSKNFHNTEAPNYSGSWKELLDCYPNVISKSHEIPNTIVIKSPRFEPELKKITIKFKDTSDNKIIIPNFLEYTIKSGDKTKRISNDQIELIGDEIGLKWEIKVNKNDKYKASSGHLLNPIFKTSKTISLDPVSRPFNWKPVIIGIFSIVIFGGIGYLGFWGYNSLFTEKDEDHKEVIKITSIDNDQIRAYIQGNELNIDSLESLKNLSSDSLLSIQLNDLIRFRMSLNTIYRDSIQVLYNSFDKLSIAHDKNKKKLLASILDSISFSDDYKTIANREVMAFYEIEDTINSIIRTKSQTSQTEEVITQSNEVDRTPTTETVVSEQETSTNNVSQDSDVNKSKYTEKEFLEKIINGQELDPSKMTTLMLNIFNLKKQKNISDKAFKDIVTSESENLARIEKKLKNSN
jgi:hypothetical protein